VLGSDYDQSDVARVRILDEAGKVFVIFRV
jgi:hypothetical protein